MESIYARAETWIRDQAARMPLSWSPPAPAGWHWPRWPPEPKGWKWPRWPTEPAGWSWPRWPPWQGRRDRQEQERLLQQECERQREQLDDLCRSVKAESLSDLQEILCSMVLAECVYKHPATEMIRAINKFKSDFGGQLVSLERVQYSLDHVPHRYLLAEAGETLFASFIGTKQYKDVITDANIFQGAIFHEDNEEDLESLDVMENGVDRQKKIEENFVNSLNGKPKKLQKKAKPAAHRGFLARAKGIPALEIYRLAQKKNRKLILCGHSLGGAVAVLVTLAILRVFASSSISKEHGKIQVKCITFSQPPVGNAALKDYVHQKGWQKYFKSYCIPEDLVPRILSPSYFHHYSLHTLQSTCDSVLENTSVVSSANDTIKSQSLKSRDKGGEQLVLGLGPVKMSLRRLSKLVPVEGVQKHLSILRRVGSEDGKLSSVSSHRPTLTLAVAEAKPESLETQEGADGTPLKLISNAGASSSEGNNKLFNGKSGIESGDISKWKRVPYLPSYVPFGQLFLLGSCSVELLSDAEYSKLISASADQLPQFPHLQQLLGLSDVGSVELGHIIDAPIIRTATTILPLGWSGILGNKNAEHLKVDIIGHGLHMCKQFQAQINGKWFSAVVESSPSMPSYSSNFHTQPDLQKMRVLIGSPIKRPPIYPTHEEILPMVPCPSTKCIDNVMPEDCSSSSTWEGLSSFVVYCTSDFISVPKQVHVRVRRVRLLGLAGSGKTSLLKAVSDQSSRGAFANVQWIHREDCFIDGLFYLDSAGVNMQELGSEARKFSKELREGAGDLSKKIDLVVVVHNLSQQIPKHGFSALLSDAKASGIPWVLAITNKFSVGSREQKLLVKSAMQAYEVHPAITEVINSSPFVVPCASTSALPENAVARRMTALKIILAPINIARIPFQRKDLIFPLEGVAAFRKLVHHVLRSHEEMAIQELANERLSLELARERKAAMEAKSVSQEKGRSDTAAAVGGASLGAGLGLILAVVMGAASALRKP